MMNWLSNPMLPLPVGMALSAEVSRARQMGLPLVALESAVITHGLPRPENLALAQAVEAEVRAQGAVPATVGLLDGKLCVGLRLDQLERLAQEDGARKISRRDFGIAINRRENGGTTVAGTLIAARLAGIRVFATGGIGGVHRNAAWDVSADLPEMARSPLVVVCAGAKAILDLPATLEYLETMGIMVLGFQTDDFPAFYARESGLGVTARVESPQEIAAIAQAQWNLGLESAILVVQPPPPAVALPADQMRAYVDQALAEAQAARIHGAAVTPFLLNRVSQLSGGASLQANLALLENNARLAGQVAVALAPRGHFI